LARKTFYRWLKRYLKKEYRMLRTVYEVEQANPTAVFEDSVRIISPDRLHLGKNVYISHNTELHCGGEKWCDFQGKITLGDHVHIGPNCVLWGAGEIELGPRARLGIGVQLISQTIDLKAIKEDSSVLDATAPPHKFAKITIGEGALVGAGAIITLGVTIGEYSWIPGNCLIKRDIPPHTTIVSRERYKMFNIRNPLLLTK